MINKSVWDAEKRQNPWWGAFHWYHCKDYVDNGCHEGFKDHQVTDKPYIEKPHLRELFHVSPGRRFSVNGIPVAYLVTNIDIGFCETCPELRNSPTSENLDKFYKGNLLSQGGRYGFPICKRLVSVFMVDLHHEGAPVKKYLSERKLSDLLDSKNTNPSIEFAKEAYGQGFDGIIWPSVRDLTDVRTDNYACIVWNPAILRDIHIQIQITSGLK